MEKYVFQTKEEMGQAAAKSVSAVIREAISKKGSANIILATGASQFEMLQNLVEDKSIAWSKVTMFHLDEYIGMDMNHSASFRKYLKERFVDRVTGLKAAVYVNGDAEDPQMECERIGELIKSHPVDVACVGIGENGHLAFNDPPADFETQEPFIIVNLDENCRKQQMGEGWFATLDKVPTQAISMSIQQIMKSFRIIVTVPDKRKAKAVKNTLEQPISPIFPASILRNHQNCNLYLDQASASLLT